jgi:hypothetical protein
VGLNAIQIDAPDVTLDLNGFTLSFTDTNGPGSCLYRVGVEY